MVYKFKIFQIIIILLLHSEISKTQNNFINDPPPVTPTLVSPLNNSEDISPTVKLVWNTSVAAVTYRLLVWDYTYGMLPCVIFEDSTLTDTSFEINSLGFNRRYRWYVSAKNLDGESPASQGWWFRTQLNDAPQIVVPFKVRNNANDSMTVRFGVAVGATYCVDEEFGEYEIPCVPPVDILEIYFTDHRTEDGSCLGAGLLLHLQGWEKNTKQDTFAFRFRAGPDGLPITFSWPNNLNEFFIQLKIVDRIDGTFNNKNMLIDTSLILHKSTFSQYVAIVGTPIPYGKPASPALLLPPDSSYIFSGSVYLEWHQSIQAYKYWLQVSESADFITTVLNDSTIKNATSILNNLQPFIKYYWRVSAINSEGTSSFSDTWSFLLSPCSVNDDPIIKRYALSQNYPNPFNSQSVVSYEIPELSFVKLNVYDILGRERSRIVDGYQQAGKYEVKIHSENLPSSIYFYCLETASLKNTSNKFFQTRKILILK